MPAGRACGAAHRPGDSFPGLRRQPRARRDVICVPGSRRAAGPDAGPRGCRPIRHDAIGTVHLQVLSRPPLQSRVIYDPNAGLQVTVNPIAPGYGTAMYRSLQQFLNFGDR